MSVEGDVLLGALLDRLGKAQAQVLLVRLDQWLAGEAHPNTKRFDQDQIRPIEGPYDRRRQDGNEIHTRHSNAASSTPKDSQP
jgi:hypothetical protein